MTSDLKSTVYTDILRDIVRGDCRPGDVLNERTLMERFAASRSVVREVLSSLCNENVLRRLPRFGYEVALLPEAEIRAVMQYRLLLETGSIPLILRSAGREEISALKKREQDVRFLNSQDVWSDWKKNSEFHLALVSLSGNRFLIEQVKRCLGVQNRVFAQYYWNKWQNISIYFTNEKHLKVLDALLENDKSAARRHLEGDLNRFGESFAGLNAKQNETEEDQHEESTEQTGKLRG